ncbi:MAG: tRNA-specific adenosine deaminase, partial [Bdellovibrionales bacterium]|nr:tRNA-specific adenosine deaminase [Bdellovibrionales bacterium]
IDSIYFANNQKDAAKIGFDDQFLYEEVARDASSRKIPMKNLMRGEAIKVFEEWELKSDKVPY